MSLSTSRAVREPISRKDSAVVAVDIGGTKTVVGRSVGDAIEPTHRFPTSQDPIEAAENVVRAAERLMTEDAGFHPRSVGIGCPGPLDPVSGTILEPPNLKPWRNFELADYIGTRIGLPVRIENDASVGALGEAHFGGGRGHGSLYYVTLSTGIGAGYVVDGRIAGGLRGMAGEVWAFDPGTFSGRPTGDTIIELASGPGLLRSFERRLAAGGRSSLERDNLDTPSLLAAADEGDELALETVEAGRNAIAALLTAVILAVAPEVVVLAGGLCTESRWFVDPIRERIRSWISIPALADVPVRRAELWDRAVLVGAAELARQTSIE